MPVREQNKVVGHAVRAMYMYTAMADLAAELGDASLKRACEALWDDVTSTRMYVTGGFGPSAANEGFTSDYDLPNDTAYAETCASVALIFWAQRMLNLDLDGKYADVLERALFNGALSGLSRDGEHYFYDNPLESDGSHSRWAWHTCPCCTMNVSRLVASVGGYFFSTGDDAIAFHLYGGIAADAGARAAGKVRIEETSTYPWSGDIRIAVDPEAPRPLQPAPAHSRLGARAPAATVNGEPIDVAAARPAAISTSPATGRRGDTVELDLPMPPERIFANPRVRADVGRVALRRGPLVYCLEADRQSRRPVSAARAAARAPSSSAERTATSSTASSP